MTVKYLSDLGYLKTTKQVAHDFREKQDILTQKVREKKRDTLSQMEEEWIEAWKKFGSKKKKKH